jgi:glycosyltransferase involved in cell wall biosynthesis
MNILLINHYGSSPTLNRTMRSFELAKSLVGSGHHVEFVIGGNNPSLGTDKQLYKGSRIWSEEGVKMLLLGLLYHTPKNRILRFISWFQFATKILLLPSKLSQKPDVIIFSSLSLPGVLSSLILARHYGARHVFEVRDIWPLTMQKLLNLGRYNPIIMVLSMIEWLGYRYSDLIVTSMPGGHQWVRQKMGCNHKKTAWIPNGVDLSRFKSLGSVSVFAENIKIIYLGSIGQANSVITLVKAAEILCSHEKLTFEIYGDGPECQNLKDYVGQKELNNIYFGGNVDQSRVSDILHSADILFHGSNDSELYSFGISPNKLSEYMASGRPILNSYSGGFDPISEGNSGLTSKAGDSTALATNILKLAEDSDLRLELGICALQQARDYSYEAVNMKYLELLKSL